MKIIILGAGQVGSTVAQNLASDANDITVWHDFDDRATAESFAGSDELKAAMNEAGVVSAPNIWITDEA